MKRKEEYLKSIQEIKDNVSFDKPRILSVIESNTLENKTIILNKLQGDSLSSHSNEYFKLKKWVNGIVRVPFGVYKKIQLH